MCKIKTKIKQLVVPNVFAIIIVATFVVNVFEHVVALVVVIGTAVVIVRKYFNEILLFVLPCSMQ